MNAQWIVRDVQRTNIPRQEGVNYYYPYTVEGVHADNGAPFSWRVPSLDDRYGFTPRAAAQLLAMEVAP